MTAISTPRYTTPTSRTMTITSMLALSLLLSSISHIARAQDEEPTPTNRPTSLLLPTLCSCSPTVFTFVLSLDQTCDNNDIELNTGIDGSFCFTEEGVTLPEPPVPLEDETNSTLTNATDLSPFPTQSPIAVATRNAITGNDGPVRLLFRELLTRRSLQDEAIIDPIVEIVSVQFLEFDTSGDLTVINQDDTYADVSLVNGDRLKFNSASSFLDTTLPLEEQASSPALVPGGASLIFYGRTESGQVVRNRFFWMYDMNCGRDNEPVKVENKIGWVTVAEISNAWPVFCPALPEGSPTISPKSNEPTLTPSVSPINPPTISPSPTSMSMRMTTAPTPKSSLITPQTLPPNMDHLPVFSKSGKSSGSKTHKVSKASKSTKSAKKGANGDESYDDGRTVVAGKTGKELDEEYSLYGMGGRVTGFDAERSNGADGSSLLRSGLVGSLVASLMVCVLFARQ